MRHFPRFLSTFGSARPEFRPAGGTKSADVSLVFCLLSPSNFKADYGQKTVFQILPVNFRCNTGIQPDQDIDCCRRTVFVMLIRNFDKNKLFMPPQKCSCQHSGFWRFGKQFHDGKHAVADP